MKVVEIQRGDHSCTYRVSIPSAVIEEAILARLKDLGQQMKLPGFRAGKAPVHVLKRRLGDSVRQEIVKDQIEKGVQLTLDEHNLKPAALPRISVESAEPEHDIIIVLDIDLIPSFEPMDFRDIQLERLEPKVSEEDIDRTLTELAHRHIDFVTPEIHRPAQMGDAVLVDLAGYTIEGDAIESMRQKDISLIIGHKANMPIPEMDNMLIGAEPGQDCEHIVTFPEGHPLRAHMSEKGRIIFHIRELREPREPGINDESFAKTLGFDSIPSLRKVIAERLEGDLASTAHIHLKQALLDILDNNHHFPVPPHLVHKEFESIWSRLEAESHTGVHPKTADAKDDKEHTDLAPKSSENQKDGKEDKDQESLRADYQRIAQRRVKLGLLFSEVGRINGLSVDKQDIEHAILDEARRYPGDNREVLKHYHNQPGALAALRASLFEDKVIDFILSHAALTVRELPLKDFVAALEDDQIKEKKGSHVRPSG